MQNKEQPKMGGEREREREREREVLISDSVLRRCPTKLAPGPRVYYRLKEKVTFYVKSFAPVIKIIYNKTRQNLLLFSMNFCTSEKNSYIYRI